MTRDKAHLGHQLNYNNLQFKPAQHIKFLRMTLCNFIMTILVPKDKISKISKESFSAAAKT
jgi:hypothetical protein